MIIGAGALVVGLIIYALIDCARTEKARIRGVSKALWILLILVLPVLGALLWLFLGKERVTRTWNGKSAQQSARPASPDDDEEYLRFLQARVRRQQQSQQHDKDDDAR